MTGALITDTHPLIWWAGSRQKLSARARRAFEACTEGRLLIYVPTVVILELALLEEHRKIRLRTPFPAWVDSLFESPGFAPVAMEPVHVKEAWAMRRFADPFDRLIVAAAVQLGIPLISKDSEIARSGLVKMYW